MGFVNFMACVIMLKNYHSAFQAPLSQLPLSVIQQTAEL